MINQIIIAIVPVSVVILLSISISNAAVANRLDEGLFSEETEGSFTLKSADTSNEYTVDHRMHSVPVRHFARHGLCRHQEGKQYFYKALKSKLCQIKEMFVATLVKDLCKQRGSLLDKWVSELFDVDGDEKISHYEKSLYKVNI